MGKFVKIYITAATIMILVFSSCQLEEEQSPPTPDPTHNTVSTNTDTSNPTVTIEPTLEPEVTPEPIPTPTPEPTPYTAPVVEVPAGMINPYKKQYASPYNSDGTLRNDPTVAGFKKEENNQPPAAHLDIDIRQFNGYYLGDISKKEIYLTFDEGYENGFTSTILDVLKEKGVKATFFVTKPYIESNPDLCIRMIEEGHIVGNHSVNHKRSYTQSDDEFIFELEEPPRVFKELTGYDMSPYFRFPEGEYSARTLSLANDLGYKSIFWSFAYLDYDVNNQPGKQYAYEHTIRYIHNGCIILLHAVSESNTQALGDIIDYIKEQGYEFKTVDQLPPY